MAVQTKVVTTSVGQYVYVLRDGNPSDHSHTVEAGNDVIIDFNLDGEVSGIEIIIDQDQGESL